MSREPAWLTYPLLTRHVEGDDHYADVINHYAGKLRYPDKMTDAHETLHMVHADIRNAHNLGFQGGGFYAGQNRALIMPAPKFRKSAVVPLVPQGLRGNRYGTYVTGMKEWDDNPLYLYDEWEAYVTGGCVCVELVQEGRYTADTTGEVMRWRLLAPEAQPLVVRDHLGNTRRLPMPSFLMRVARAPGAPNNWTDGVMGLLEFSVYALAVVRACLQHDPDYLTATPDFLAFTHFTLHRAAAIYAAGSVMDEFKWDRQDAYLQTLRTADEAAPLRALLAQYFDGAWLSATPQPQPKPQPQPVPHTPSAGDLFT